MRPLAGGLAEVRALVSRGTARRTAPGRRPLACARDAAAPWRPRAGGRGRGARAGAPAARRAGSRGRPRRSAAPRGPRPGRRSRKGSASRPGIWCRRPAEATRDRGRSAALRYRAGPLSDDPTPHHAGPRRRARRARPSDPLRRSRRGPAHLPHGRPGGSGDGLHVHRAGLGARRGDVPVRRPRPGAGGLERGPDPARLLPRHLPLGGPRSARCGCCCPRAVAAPSSGAPSPGGPSAPAPTAAASPPCAPAPPTASPRCPRAGSR